jgi:hypothetical protein
MLKGDISKTTLAEITALTERISRDLESRRSGAHVKRAFNAEAQRISTTGDHKYVSGPIELHNMELHLLMTSLPDCARPQRSPWTLPWYQCYGKPRLPSPKWHLHSHTDDYGRQ